MREHLTLTFRLPVAMAFAVARGRWQPSLHGCVTRIGAGDLVEIEAPDRARAFAQAARLLHALGRGGAPCAIAAVLAGGRPPRRDAWTIIVGAEIAFAPTGLGAEVFAAGDAAVDAAAG